MCMYVFILAINIPQLTKQILSEFHLAQLLKLIVDGLSRPGIVRVKLNHCLPLDFSLHSPTTPFSNNKFINKQSKSNEYISEVLAIELEWLRETRNNLHLSKLFTAGTDDPFKIYDWKAFGWSEYLRAKNILKLFLLETRKR